MSVLRCSWLGAAEYRSGECGNILIVQAGKVPSQFIRHSFTATSTHVIDAYFIVIWDDDNTRVFVGPSKR